MNVDEQEQLINAIYCQILDVTDVPEQFRRRDLDLKLNNGDISVREFVKTLASSDIYMRRFYAPYPNPKVIEFLFRHLLGRTPASAAEVAEYEQMLSSHDLKTVVEAIVNSAEYVRYFGEDVVPYKRP